VKHKCVTYTKDWTSLWYFLSSTVLQFCISSYLWTSR